MGLNDRRQGPPGDLGFAFCVAVFWQASAHKTGWSFGFLPARWQYSKRKTQNAKLKTAALACVPHKSLRICEARRLELLHRVARPLQLRDNPVVTDEVACSDDN
jgi:hypothetical protein